MALSQDVSQKDQWQFFKYGGKWEPAPCKKSA